VEERESGGVGGVSEWSSMPARVAMARGAVILFGLTVLVACVDDGGPRLDTVVPGAAHRDATVMITGRRLCGGSGDCTTAAGEIQLGLAPRTVRAMVVSYSDTEAQIAIPSVAPLGDTVLIVTVNERSSNALDFEVLP
jgi:hypothetical protein